MCKGAACCETWTRERTERLLNAGRAEAIAELRAVHAIQAVVRLAYLDWWCRLFERTSERVLSERARGQPPYLLLNVFDPTSD